jgi:VWFA-related protein
MTCSQQTNLAGQFGKAAWQQARNLSLAATLVCCIGVKSRAQSQAPVPSSASTPSQAQPAATFKAASRMVTVEVVAKDHQGHAITGLTADDFQVSEKVEGKREQHPEKIASFRAVSVSALATHESGKVKLPPGVYTNLVTMGKVPVPPTVLLIDGINTDRISQMQVHQQMVKMVGSIPDDVPVAVFLLGRRLVRIQDFTTDIKLLKTAIQKSINVESNAATQVEPIDDPDAMSAVLEDDPHVSADSLNAVEQFEREVYAMQMDMRVRETLDALRAIARHLAGYPGRKNLLWISSSFPIAIEPDMDLGWSGFRTYQSDMATVATALADAKVAVYPMDPAGLQSQSVFQASTRVRGAAVRDPRRFGQQIQRENTSRYDRQQSMEVLAEQTGGIVCVENNDLGDCVRKAVNDGSSFYEIAYYPDSSNWHGEFHKIIVKSNKGGLRLAYRQGYYAKPDEGSEQNSKDAQQVACQDYLTSTSVLLVAKQYPAEKPGEAKFYTAIYPTTLTFVPQDDGSRKLDLIYAVCAFDRTGKPLQFMHQDFDAKLNDKQYSEIQSQYGFPHIMVFPIAPGTSKLRLLVRDIATGQMGSVNVPYSEMATSTSMPAATPKGESQSTAH